MNRYTKYGIFDDIKRNEILTHAIGQMSLENFPFTLSERSQTQKPANGTMVFIENAQNMQVHPAKK